MWTGPSSFAGAEESLRAELSVGAEDEPGKALFRTGGMAGIPGAYQAMERREALRVMVDTRK